MKLRGRTASKFHLLDQGNQGLQKAVFLCFILYFFILSANWPFLIHQEYCGKWLPHCCFTSVFSSRALMHQHSRPQIKIPVRENLTVTKGTPININHTDLSYTGFFQYQFEENYGRGEELGILPFCWRCQRLKLM